MQMTSPQHSVYGVMVTFNPDDGLRSRLPAIVAQLDALVVVDNSRTAEVQEQLRQWCEAIGPQVRYTLSPENNLARAQNIGIREALGHADATHILLLDDDSEPAPDMVKALLAASEPSVGLVAPHMLDRNTQRAVKHVVPRGFGFKLAQALSSQTLNGVLHVIASGSLIARATFERVGFMDEMFGIDYVDKDFCLRLWLAGLGMRVAARAVLYHTIGECKDHQLAGLRVTATNHPPERRYTIYRNRIWCLRRYGLKVRAFLLHELGGIAYDILRIGLYEKDRMAKYKAMLRGIAAGLSSPC